MLYLSTRGHPDRKHFCDILLEGLAPDGGLYLPEHYPQIDDAKLTQLRKAYHEQGYAELAFQILSLYIDDIPAADLKALCAKTYTAEVFGTGEIVPLRHLEDGLWLEALSNGPTLAFKDMQHMAQKAPPRRAVQDLRHIRFHAGPHARGKYDSHLRRAA